MKPLSRRIQLFLKKPPIKSQSALFVRTGKIFLIALLGIICFLLGTGIYLMDRKSDLKVWHTANLKEEFRTSRKTTTFEEYLAREERLFLELEEKVYSKIEEEDQHPLNRFHKGSISDPGSESVNWNRTFEFAPDSGEAPAYGVLLLHGLSDSPYSLRAIGGKLRREGAHVLGLRIPGHGTAPSSLASTRWQDMAEAVEIAAKHLDEQLQGAPLCLVGYSNGGALALHYTLCTLEDPDLPTVDRIALLSPEIGISPAAGFAVWQERLGLALGLEKLLWNSINPEYDPYKYSSFPVNGGELAHRLTKANRKKVARLAERNLLGDFPPTIAFQSAVDATVSARALVTDLFLHLPENNHELVIFGLNRSAMLDAFLTHDPEEQIPLIIESPRRNFKVVHLENLSGNDGSVTEVTWGTGEITATTRETNFSWPNEVYSLSHVALPFPPDDPIYGGEAKNKSPINLGNLALRGEKKTLRVSGNNMLRLRWNPFYSYLENRIVEFFPTETP